MRRHPSLRLALAAALLAPLGAVACSGRAPAPAAAASAATPAVATPAGGFSLYDLSSAWRDQRGAEVRLPSLAGKVRVVAMVYTSCQATCPLIVGDLKRIEASIPAERRDDVGFVLVSIDPERDSPERMAQWAARTQLDPARWTLLAGGADEVREVAAVLGVRYQPQADGELAHTNAITVLDPAGAVAHQQLGLGAETKGTADAVGRLLR
jgi:protein SCO1/2